MSLKATITDSEALRAITPEMLMNYLSAHYKSWRTEADYRRNSPLPPADILVPTRGSADYAHRMWDAVNALARIEDRSQLDIYCELVGKPTYEELEAAVQEACNLLNSEHVCPVREGYLEASKCPHPQEKSAGMPQPWRVCELYWSKNSALDCWASWVLVGEVREGGRVDHD